MSTELAISREKLESFLPVLGAEVTEDEKLQDADSGEILTNDEGNVLTVDEIGYLGHGSVEPVEDDFSAIVSHLSDRDIRED
ncbi:hypothetical protein IL252_15810 [Halomicrobium sp. IBSBa]|uniref:hypothetical protein n=1 Tax=Halomicrobium sp. IBSBa TaxID=2778916 RepID=UPI001ABF6E7C|nr:hypothetical protein [Halomicrobium sp. IBSBa]MBO4249281.1 hypothetical protein [Halomicrobium sp. IBSBa]